MRASFHFLMATVAMSCAPLAGARTVPIFGLLEPRGPGAILQAVGR